VKAVIDSLNFMETETTIGKWTILPDGAALTG
jgi:hypothetical protein